MFASVAAATTSAETPRSSATQRAVWTTCAGSHRLPRSGTGARYGAVGLDEDPVERRPGRHLPNGARAFERHDAGEREIEPQRERALCERPIFAEAVNDPADVARPFSFEDRQRLGGGRSRVDHDGLAELAGETDEAREDFALRLPRRPVVVVVEAYLADGRHLGQRRERSKALVERARPPGCIVRMETDAGRDATGGAPRQIDGEARRLEAVRVCGFALRGETDDHQANDAGGARPLEDRIGSFLEMRGVEVAVRVGQAEHPGRERSPRQDATLGRMVDAADGDRRSETTGGPPDATLMVFAQRADARLDIGALGTQAERFFATRLGLAEDKRYAPGDAPRTDEARFVVAPVGAPPGIRAAFARPRDDADLALAVDADNRAGPGGTGLALVARRCQTVWLVSRETDPDPLALRLAAILASVLLGPILDVRVPELFGVKTARAKLEALLG